MNSPLSLVDPEGLSDDDPQKKQQDGKVQTGAPKDCSQVRVEIKVDQTPKTVTNQQIHDVNNNPVATATGVEGKLVITVKIDNKPAEGVAVTESNQDSTTKNGVAQSSKLVEGTATTNANGQFGDTIGLYQTTDGTKARNNVIKSDFKNNEWTTSGTQTLTLSVPSIGTCMATSTRSLSNAGPKGPRSKFTLTTTQPVVKPKP